MVEMLKIVPSLVLSINPREKVEETALYWYLKGVGGGELGGGGGGGRGVANGCLGAQYSAKLPQSGQ